MASTDPRKTREFGPTSDADEYDADEDPLVELARIVSEDGGFSSRTPERPKVRPVEPSADNVRRTQPHAERVRPVEPPAERPRRAEPPAESAKRAEPPADEFPTPADLEAELLQELETSFSVRRSPRHDPEPPPAEPVAPPPPAAPPVRPREPVTSARPANNFQPTRRQEPALNVEDPDELLRSIEEQLSQFEHQVRSEAYGAAMDEPAAEDAAYDAYEESIADEPIAEEPAPAEPRMAAPARAEAAREESLPGDEVDWSLAGSVHDEPEPEPSYEPEPEPEIAPEPVDEDEEAPVMASPRSEYRFRGPAARGSFSAEAAEEARAAAYEEEPQAAAYEPEPEPLMSELDAALSAGFPPAVEEEDAAAEEFAEPEEEPDFPASAHEAEMQRGMRDFASLEAELSKELDSAYSGPEAEEVDSEPEEPLRGSEEAVERSDMAASAPRSGEPRGAPGAAVILPEHGMRAPPRPARSRKGLMTAAAIVIVVAAGGGAAIMYLRSLEQAPSGPPPVISAPEGPVKIEPAQQADAQGEDTVGDAVYNRVAGRAPDTEEKVVDGAEEPQEIARIVLPSSQTGAELQRPVGGSGDQAQAAGDTTSAPDATGSGSAVDDFGPRRVPTFVVKPDGTIVATADAGAATAKPDLGGQQMVSAQTAAMEPKPVDTVTIDEPRIAGTPAEPAAPAGSMATQEAMAPAAAPAPAESIAPADETPAPTQLAERKPTQEPEPTAAEPAASPAPAPKPAVALAAPAESVPPTAASGYLVQISSQTSQDAALATFSDLKKRYPSILGGLEANIEKAELDKGTYYRVRVGPWADRAEATQVCSALKEAGGDCYVTR